MHTLSGCESFPSQKERMTEWPSFSDTAAGSGLSVHADGFLRFEGVLFLLEARGLVTLGTELHKGFGFDVEARDITVDNGLPDDAEGSLRAEIIFVVELVDHLHHVFGGEARVLDVGHLVAAAVFHLFVGDETVLLGEVVELCTRIGVGDGDLDGLAVKGLGEVDGVADGLFGLARKAEDEVGVDDEAEVVAVFDEVAGALDGGTLLNVLEDLRIAGLEADDEEAAASVLHGLESIAVGGGARGAGPGDAKRLEFFAEFNRAGLLDVEGVVVEEEHFDVGEVFFGPLHLGSHIICRPLAPGVAGEGLGPEAEGALRRASACRVEGDVRVEQEGDVVFGDVHVAFVDLGGPGHGVKIFNLRSVGVVLDDAARIFVTNAEDFVEGFSVGVFDDGEIELAAADEVDDFALVEGAVGVRGDRWADECNLDGGVRVLDGPGKTVVAAPAYNGDKKNKKVKALG